jgi:hypothetical protein
MRRITFIVAALAVLAGTLVAPSSASAATTPKTYTFIL